MFLWVEPPFLSMPTQRKRKSSANKNWLRQKSSRLPVEEEGKRVRAGEAYEAYEEWKHTRVLEDMTGKRDPPSPAGPGLVVSTPSILSGSISVRITCDSCIAYPNINSISSTFHLVSSVFTLLLSYDKVIPTQRNFGISSLTIKDYSHSRRTFLYLCRIPSNFYIS